jgi:hypothetical protein
MANCWRGASTTLLRPECSTGPSAGRRTVWLDPLFGWYDLPSEGLSTLRLPIFQSATSGPVFLKCGDAPGHMADGGTKDSEFIAEQTLEALEDSALLGRRLSSYKVAHCYAQPPWILRWVGISSLLTHTPYRPWLTLSPLLGQLFDTPDLVPTPGRHTEPLLLCIYALRHKGTKRH